MHQFNNDVSVATHISIADLQQLQSQNNVQAGVLAKIGQQNLKKYKMVAKTLKQSLQPPIFSSEILSKIWVNSCISE